METAPAGTGRGVAVEICFCVWTGSGVPGIVFVPSAFENGLIAGAVFGIFPAFDAAAVEVVVQRVLFILGREPDPETIGIGDLAG